MSLLSSGIFLLDKAPGLSSAAAIAQLRRKLDIKKIGHAGTLDPMATGLLVVLVNGATRLAQYAEDGDKEYSGEILFGRETDTDDVTGATLRESTSIPTLAQVEAAIPSFLGEISQIPPDISALKIRGKRACDRVRDGEEVTLLPRTVKIHAFTITEAPEGRIGYRIECSKGTYIRSIARDLGKKLGCGACLFSIRREASFPFFAKQSKAVTEISESDMFSGEVLFPGVRSVSLPIAKTERLMGGDQRILAELAEEIAKTRGVQTSVHEYLIHKHPETGRMLGLLVNDGGEIKIGVNFGAQE